MSIGQKIKNFFFPKDFKNEMYRGMKMSSPYGCSAVLIPILTGLGRLARKIVDPQHKMFGQERRINERKRRD